VPTLRQVACTLLAGILPGLLAGSRLVSGSVATVPDDVPTIQAAIELHVDTVLVRPGAYAETPAVSLPVLIAGAATTSPERPVLQGLVIRPARGFGLGTFAFERLGFTASVLVVNDDELCDIRFGECDVAAGLRDSSQYLSTASMSFSKCTLAGSIRVFVAGHCEIDSCQVNGELWVGDRADLRITGAVFAGTGNGIAIVGSNLHSCFVEGNTIRNYAIGVGADSDYGLVANNVIEDCSDAGVRAGGELTVANNAIRRCQVVGVDLRPNGYGTISGNTIERCGWRGVWIGSGGDIVVTDNLLAHCGGDGLEIGAGYYWTVRISGNTSCFNGGSGFASRFPNGNPGTVMITRNIGFANGEYGLTWAGEDSATVNCNDWFANVVGAVGGRVVSERDLLMDPRFCNPDSGDFHLRGDSPLLDPPGCGPVGALRGGCGVTPTLVEQFSADRVNEGIRIRWEVGDPLTGAQVWLERAEGAHADDWVRPLTDRSMDGRGVVEIDRTVSPDRSYWYRLMCNGQMLAPPILVESQDEPKFALSRIVPNPAAGPVRIEFSLERPAEIDLGIFDVQGRGIGVLARGLWPAGSHVVEWNGLKQDGTVAPAGWYVVRYRHPGGREVQRLIRSF
jgi:hypothetical protein